jgi:flagellar biosynthetic protein FliP
MQPYGNEMNQKALQPLLKGQISQTKAIKIASEPMRKFMLKQIRPKDLSLFVGLSKTKAKSIEECETYVLLPAFIISEVKTAFQMGFLIYLPFLIIDMVVASVLMSMGMFMLSPMTISTPFKLLLFVMIDGWNLLIEGLVKSFK